MAMVAAGLLVVAGCGDGGDGRSAVDFCDRFTTYETDRDALSERNAATEGGLDVEELKADYAAVQEQLDGLADAAPDDVADDLARVIDAVRQVDEEVADAETVEDIAAASDRLAGQEEVEAAGARVQEWVDANCDVVDDGT